MMAIYWKLGLQDKNSLSLQILCNLYEFWTADKICFDQDTYLVECFQTWFRHNCLCPGATVREEIQEHVLKKIKKASLYLDPTTIISVFKTCLFAISITQLVD